MMIDNEKQQNKIFEIEQLPQKVGVALIDSDDTDIALNEITELVRTLGCEVVLSFTQKRTQPDDDTFFGSGKIQEVADTVEKLQLDCIVFDGQLTPVQHRNIQKIVKCLVIDRTQLIIEIFAKHATTAEGKIQVELANLKYQLPRLHSIKGELSRQGAGVLARGAGETKLELDKRRIRDRITNLKAQLKELEKQRDVKRANRQENEIAIVSLVGYTNVGKSTLFNLLTNSSVLVENKLFATLDTTVRKCQLPNGLTFLMTDTVGFIRNLPHDLVEAFHSTLEETKFADLILNVCDCSDTEMEEHQRVTKDLLTQLGVTAPVINVYNKFDKSFVPAESFAPDAVLISALNKTGIDTLLDAIQNKLMEKYTKLKLLIPFDSMNSIAQIMPYGVNITIDYNDNGEEINGFFDNRYIRLLSKFIVS